MPAFAKCIWATVFPSRDFIWRFLRRDFFILFGGANRDRTDDLYNAIVALSQLSYGPFAKQFGICLHKLSQGCKGNSRSGDNLFLAI